MAATAQQLLDAVNDAILELIQGGQRTTVNGRTFEHAQLEELRTMRAELEREVAREARSGVGGGMRARRIVPCG